MFDPVTIFRFSRWLYRHGFRRVPYWIDRMNQLVFHCYMRHANDIGENITVGYHGTGVAVHPKAKLGDNVFLAPFVIVGGKSQTHRVPIIGNNVYIAVGAKVLGGVTVGDDVVIGANAVVIRSVPPRSIVAGIPARIVKTDVDPYDFCGWPPRRFSKNKKLKVFHLVGCLELGGTETQAVQVACRMKDRGFEVVMGCLRAGGPLQRVLEESGVEVQEFNTQGGILSVQGLWQLRRLSRYLKTQQFDVMHAHDLWSNLIGVPAARLAKTTVIISSRRNMADWGWFTPTRKLALRLIQRRSTVILANAQAIKDVLVNEKEFPARQIRVVHNAVDWKRFADVPPRRTEKFPQFTGDDKLIIMVANMNREIKGHRVVIDATPQIIAKFPRVRFIFVGDGAQREVLEAKIRALGIENNFLFLGKRNDVPELLACADIALLASLMEGMPNAVLEYMSAGLPVVSTRAGGAGEIIEDGVNGLLVPTNDSQALASAILRLLEDPAYADRLGDAAQSHIKKNFSFERLLRELHEMYIGIPKSRTRVAEDSGGISSNAATAIMPVK